MTFVKIGDNLYPATISGKLNDRNWDNRKSKSITLEMDYDTASALFVDGLAWSIVERLEAPVYDEEGNETGSEFQDVEWDNSEYNLAGDILIHRDGTLTVKMGVLTDLEEAYMIMLGGAE